MAWYGRTFPAPEILACRNGLVHLPSLVVRKEHFTPPTLRSFSPNCLAFDFDLDAPRADLWLRFLSDLWPTTQEAVERNPELKERIAALVAEVDADLSREARTRPGVDGPVAFFCAEFGFHSSMPIYSG